jgi:predicted MFS family arabinose efflux permease
MAEGRVLSGSRVFAGALGIYTAGGLFWAFLPFFVGLQVGTGGMTPAEAGTLGSAYLAGFSLASITGLWWVPRFNWRITIAAAVAIVVLGLLALAEAAAYGISIASVFVIGLMMGGIWSIAYRIFAATTNPDRSFATAIVVAYSGLALVSYVVGQFVVPDHGLRGSAYLLSAVIVVLGFSTLLVPAGLDTGAAHSTAISYRPTRRAATALLGILVTGFAFAAVWAFAERIGVGAGFGASGISPVVASNLLASAAGSVLATVLGIRLGRRRTLVGGMALMAAAILSLSWSETYWIYALGIVGLGFTIGFVLPYQMGTLAALDAEGRFVVLIAAAQGIGSAAGPALGGAAIAAGGVQSLVVTATLAVALGVILFLSIPGDEKA